MHHHRLARKRILVAVAVFVAAAALLFGASTYVDQTKSSLAIAVLLGTYVLVPYVLARLASAVVRQRYLAKLVPCPHCGYDLTGNESGTCPECGARLLLSDLLREIASLREAEAGRTSRRARAYRALRALAAGLLCAAAGAAGLWGFQIWRSPAFGTAEFEPAPCPFAFVRWNKQSELAEVEPLTVFAVLNGSIRFRVTFTSPDKNDIQSVDVWDAHSRPWIYALVAEGNYAVNVHAPGDANPRSKAPVTVRDTNRDGMPDRKWDWPAKTVYRLADPLPWVRQDNNGPTTAPATMPAKPDDTGSP